MGGRDTTGSYVFDGLADHNNCRNLALLRIDGKFSLAGVARLLVVRIHFEETGIARYGGQVFGSAPLRTSAIRLTAWNGGIYTVDSAPGMVPASLE